MKKIKTIACMLVIVILFNFIGIDFVYADDEGKGTDEPAKPNYGLFSNSTPSNEVIATTGEGYANSRNDGGSPVQLVTSAVGSIGNFIVGTVLGLVATAINVIFALQIDIMVGTLTATEEKGDLQFLFTIDRLVFNRIPLLNVNYFNTYEESGEKINVGDLSFDPNPINITIKKSVVKAYYICKMIALSLSLVVLIYIGIRMALSTIASDQAKYKKMLVSWLESVILLFLMVYIMSAVIIFGELLTNMFYNIRCNILDTVAVKQEVFENIVRKEAFAKILSFNGMELTEWSLIYWFMLFTQIRFLWLYIKRFLMIGFLIAISPLITITYSIDKAGDGKAQAFSAWLNEFILNVLIQPLHALLYLILVLTANSICSRSPLLSALLLMGIGQAEKIVKVVFGMNKTVTLRGVNSLGSKEG